MSARTPILIVSLVICAWALAVNKSAAAKPASAVYFLIVSSPISDLISYTDSDPEILLQPLGLPSEVGVCDHVDDAAVLNDVVPVGDGRGKSKILFNQQDREPFRLQRPQDHADLLDDDRRQALGRLVEQ